MWVHSEMDATYKQTEEIQIETYVINILIMNFSASSTVREINVCCLKHPVWYIANGSLT